MLLAQPGLGRFINVGTARQPLIRGLRDRLVNPHRPASAFVPLQQLEGWLAVVGEPAPLLGVEVVHQRHQLGMLEPFVPEELADVRPVLLFAMGVVVLAIGAAAGEGHLHLPSGHVLIERPVQKLRPVVGVAVLHLERNGVFKLLELAEDGMAALVPDGTVLRPPAEQLGEREGIDVITRRGVAAVGHGVGLDRTGFGRVGRTAAGWHLPSQQRAGAGGAKPFARIPDAHGLEPAVNLRRTQLPAVFS